MKRPPETAQASESRAGLLMLAFLSLIAGAGAGLSGALFRLALDRADHVRGALLAFAGETRFGPLFAIAACAAATATAAFLVRRFSKHASGSGIPHVEAVLHGLLPPAGPALVPVKFLGGVLAIGAGLALGREGPSVQMGAAIAHSVGRAFRRDFADRRVLLAAGAGAGLAGAVFVLEELVQRFEPRIAIAALGASTTAIFTARFLLGEAPDFDVAAIHPADAATEPLFFLLGGFAGVLAVLYNRAIVSGLAVADRARKLPTELRAGLIGAAVGALALVLPDMVGGGEAIAQRMLAGNDPFAALPFFLALRLLLGAVSYAAATPGGLFAPLLAVGAQFGLIFGILGARLFPDLDIQPEGFALVGMAALFSGMVRAPVTGLVLVTEMTASVALLLPLLGACFTAMLAPALLGDPPIYESLRELTLARERDGDGDKG